jgi:hypothetical protein
MAQGPEEEAATAKRSGAVKREDEAGVALLSVCSYPERMAAVVDVAQKRCVILRRSLS